MKYLKSYNESVISEDIISDICLELEDIGVNISINSPYNFRIEGEMWNEFGVEYKEITWNDIKDCILRLKDYLGNNFDYIDIQANDQDYEDVDLNNMNLYNIKNNTIISSFIIKYKK